MNINNQGLFLIKQFVSHLQLRPEEFLPKEACIIIWNDILSIYNFLSKEYIELKEDWPKFNYLDFM